MPLPPSRARANVLGVGIDALNMATAVSAIDAAIAAGQKGYVCVTGVHGVMEAQRDDQFRTVLNNSFLTTPDGMPTVWVGKWQGFRRMDRVYGPDLMLAVCEMSTVRRYTHYLYGGKPGVTEQLRSVLERRFPGIRVVGTYCPPFRRLNREEECDLIQHVGKLQPDLFWVGLSTPKQERFMAEFIHKLDARVMVGVGAAFDIHTGQIKDSPPWVKRAGLQWLHRLSQEPGRLWKRYLLNNPQFLLDICLQFAGLRTYPTPAAGR
ncbi:MAG TPA: WecB/TagA/CpsF family glycosyltransferase [Terriglobales bacterium]|nr:WecB/TagA/CpsF family glycosyltransferase [Terriglobales bacterium]